MNIFKKLWKYYVYNLLICHPKLLMRHRYILIPVIFCVALPVLTSQHANALTNPFNRTLNQSQQFTFSGEGIVWEEDCTSSENRCITIGESTSFSGTISLVLEGFEVFWEIDIEIYELGISESFYIGGDDGYIDVDDSGRFVTFESWDCWGCDCDKDPENPEECGSENFSLLLNLDDWSGFITVENNSSNEETHESYWWELIGSVNVSQ